MDRKRYCLLHSHFDLGSLFSMSTERETEQTHQRRGLTTWKNENIRQRHKLLIDESWLACTLFTFMCRFYLVFFFWTVLMGKSDWSSLVHSQFPSRWVLFGNLHWPCNIYPLSLRGSSSHWLWLWIQNSFEGVKYTYLIVVMKRTLKTNERVGELTVSAIVNEARSCINTYPTLTVK